MKKWMQKMLTVCLAIAMMVTVLAPVTAEAKATKNQTMYVGENFEYCIFGTTIQSVSSSKKSVATVAKVSGQKYAFKIKAKKPGATNVTVKYKTFSGVRTEKFKVTVKKTDIKITVQSMDDNKVLLKIKNNTTQPFDSVFYDVTFRDSTGDIVKHEEDQLTLNVSAGKTAYDTVYLGGDMEVDLSSFTYKIKSARRYPEYAYKNASSKELVVTQKNVSEEDNKITFDLKMQNKLNKDVNGVNYIIYYDADDHIIAMDSYSFSLSPKETKTATDYSVYRSEYSHPTFDHYKVVTQAFSKVYIKK